MTRQKNNPGQPSETVKKQWQMGIDMICFNNCFFFYLMLNPISTFHPLLLTFSKTEGNLITIPWGNSQSIMIYDILTSQVYRIGISMVNHILSIAWISISGMVVYHITLIPVVQCIKCRVYSGGDNYCISSIHHLSLQHHLLIRSLSFPISRSKTVGVSWSRILSI